MRLPTLHLALFLQLAIPLSFATTTAMADDAEIRVELPTFNVEGGKSAPLTAEAITIEENGTSIDTIQLSLSHAKSHNSLRFPISVQGETYNTLSFEAKFEGEPLPISVILTDRDGRTSATRFSKFAKKLDNGWYAFKWDIVNQPDTDQGINPADLVSLAFKFTFSAVAEGTTEKIGIRNLRFLSGEGVSTGDPALFSQWKEYAKAYRPDYSDSSAALKPPKNGRIPTPLPLISNGKAVGEIVLAPDALAPEQTAAKELQLWLSKITAAEVPIVSESSSKKPSILIGRKFAEAIYPDDIAKLGTTDGFAVRTKGQNVYIFGSVPRGTINGVLAFLENNSDIIWARPHADYGTVYSNVPNLDIVWGDALEIPSGKLRFWLQNAGGTPGWFSHWAARNRSNHNMRTPEWGEWSEIGGGHNLQVAIPKDDPTYYPVIKGKKPEKLSIWKHQICLSAPNLTEVYAANLLKGLDEKGLTNVDILNIKIEDNWGVCECEQCTAPITLPDGEKLSLGHPAFRSTQFFKFLNEVTEKLAQARPNIKVQTYAYFYTSTPPKIPLQPNIYILFCPYVRKDHRTPLYSPVNDHWWKMQKAWGEKTPNVVVREYYGISNNGRPLAEVVAADIKARISQGVPNFTSETNDDDLRLWWDGSIRGSGNTYDVDMMDRWVITRLYWNADADVEALRKYFIARTFREAAPEIERVFGMIREDWFKQRGSSTWGGDVLRRTFSNPDRQDEVRRLLETALEKAKHPTARILTARLKERIEGMALSEKAPALETAKKVDGKSYFSAGGILNYAWSLPAHSTTIERDGEFRDGIRVRFTNDKEIAGTRPFLTDLSNRTIRFNLVRTVSSANVNAANLPKLKLIQGKHRREAGEYQANADGSFTCEWTPDPNGIDLTAVGRFELVYPKSQLEDGDFDEFVITDISVTENETAATQQTQ